MGCSMMKHRYDRPNVKYITKQWVHENCKTITTRDIGLLKLLYENKRRLLRRDQIERLYPVFESTKVLNRRLKFLFQKHVIDRIYPPVGLNQGSSQQHICLDRAGIILLEIDNYNKPIIYDEFHTRRLPLGWEHKVLINEYECVLKNIDGQLIKYIVEDPIPYNDTKLIPDIACVIRHDTKGYNLFLEIDLGTEDIPRVKEKLDNYKHLYLSEAWKSHPICSIFKTKVFPKVLFFTKGVRRIKTLQEYTKESSIQFRFYLHEQAKDILEKIKKTST